MNVRERDCDSVPHYSLLNDTVWSLTQNASGIPVPLLISLLTYGCYNEYPRTFAELALIYSTSQTEMPFSGAIISEWHAHELETDRNAESLMTWDPDTWFPDGWLPGTAAGGLNNSVPKLPDFTNLQQAWQKLMPTGVHIDDYTPLLTPPPCPTVPFPTDTWAETDEGWQINGSVPLPTRGQELNGSLLVDWGAWSC